MLATLAIAVLAVVWMARADDPVKPSPAKADSVDEMVKKLSTIRDQTALKQEILAQQFRTFEQSLLQLAQRLEKSSKPEDRDKAVLLKKAVELAGKEGINTRFDKLISLLKSSQVDKLEDVQSAITESETLVRDLRELLQLLLSDNRAAQLKAEEKRLTELIKEINKIIRDEKTIRAQNDSGRMDKDALARAQADVTRNTEAVARAMGGGKDGGKSGDTAKGEAKTGGQGNDAKGQGKSDTPEGGKGEAKDSQGQSGTGKEGSGKEGSGKEGSGKEGSGKEGSGKEGSGKEGSGKEGSGKEGSGKEGSGKEATGKEGSGKQGAESGSGAKGAGKSGGEPGQAKSGGKQGSEGGKESSGSQGSQAKGQGDGKGEGKSGGQGNESKSASKGGGQGQQQAGQGKSGGGDPSAGGPQPPQPPGPPQPPTPGKKQVQDAIENQKRAEDNIRNDKPDDASRDLDDAIKNLEQAKKQLEEILRQMREEEIERILAALQARCERMLQMQIEVYEGTVRVDQSIGESPDKKATRADEQKALQLSDREGEIVSEANKAIALLEAEGSAVAFPRVFEDLRDDMRTVQRRLGKADVGVVTQTIEQDIIATLKEMIEALKKARQERTRELPGQQPPQQGQPPPQNLIDQIAELKMIRAMQIRVNNRTETYGKQYPGEQADAPEIREELRNLADRQQKIFEVTRDIATGKNR
jgi:hypothetical protein